MPSPTQVNRIKTSSTERGKKTEREKNTMWMRACQQKRNLASFRVCMHFVSQNSTLNPHSASIANIILMMLMMTMMMVVSG